MPETPTGQVFISYSRRDTEAMLRIVSFLRGRGIAAWVDNENLVPGTPIWEREIEKAIKGASAAVVILSPEAKESVWVLNELTLVDEYNKRVFPVLVRGDFRDSIPFRLVTRQFVDLRTNEGRGLESLSAALSRYLDELKLLEEVRQAAEREEEGKKQAEAERIAKQKAEEEGLAKEKLRADERARLAQRERQNVQRKSAEKAGADAERKEIPHPITEKPETHGIKKHLESSFGWRTWGLIGIAIVSIIAIGMVFSSLFNKPEECSDPDVFCVGLVTDLGKINDKSYNQSVWEALQQAEQELGAVIQYIETTDTNDFAKNIALFADGGYDVIVTVGFLQGEATVAAASAYPDIKFIGIEQFQLTEIPNLVSLEFSEDEGGFLAGALAAMMTKSQVIGAVCGTDLLPLVWQYGEGFKAGAAYVDAITGYSTDVFVVYHSDVGFEKTFADPEWGATTAQFMMDKGADVIFGCGGLTGDGAVIAGAQAGAYVIGVETDQFFTLPEAAPRMLSSAVKLFTPGVFELIEMAKDENFPSGNYFGTVGYAPFHEFEDQVPPDVKAEMERTRAGLLDGSINTNVAPMKP